MGKRKQAKKPTPIDNWVLRENRAQDGKQVEFSGTRFDEVYIGEWFSMEQMDTRKWWFRVGDNDFNVTIEKDGTVTLTPQR